MKIRSVRSFVMFMMIVFSAYADEPSCDYKLNIPEKEISTIKSMYPGAIWDGKAHAFNIALKNSGHIKIVYMACENVGVTLSVVVNNSIETKNDLLKNALGLSKVIFADDYPIILNQLNSDEFQALFQGGRKVQSNTWFIEGELYNLNITLDDIKGQVILEIAGM